MFSVGSPGTKLKESKLDIFSGKSVLITGGTGSFGNAFVRYVLNNHRPARIVVFSRDEMKQWHMAERFRAEEDRVRFFIGDVRDQQRLRRAMSQVDIVIHAAATKIVPTAEYNPLEAVKTNVEGAANVIEASIDAGVKKVIALSTDKASSPVNLYGATKLVSDKLFSAANSYSGNSGPVFSVVRYGNVLGSRGSFLPFFVDRSKRNLVIPLTHKEMTRFVITLQQGIELVVKAVSEAKGGEIFVRKIPSIRMEDVAKGFSADGTYEIVGIRPGEKIHEQMIAAEEAERTLEFNDHFRILPFGTPIENYSADGCLGGVEKDFVYASNTNKEWLNFSDIEHWLKSNPEEMEIAEPN